MLLGNDAQTSVVQSVISSRIAPRSAVRLGYVFVVIHISIFDLKY